MLMWLSFATLVSIGNGFGIRFLEYVLFTSISYHRWLQIHLDLLWNVFDAKAIRDT